MITSHTVPTLSASNLRLFGECERLYAFSYVSPRPWPAPTNADQERTERLMEDGQRLHRLIHHHAQGLDPRPLARMHEKLRPWYERYRASAYAALAGEVFSEQVLTLPVAGRKLTVTYDRLVRDGERWLIIDWKTSRKAPEAEGLADDWQAKLYPFALVEAGMALNGGQPIAPESIEMVFYYLESGQELRFPYDAAAHARTANALAKTVVAIDALVAGAARPTGKLAKGGKEPRCVKPSVCKFYSLCHMAAVPASYAADEGPSELIVELELATEFEFDDEAVFL